MADNPKPPKRTLKQRVQESRLYKRLFNPDPSYDGQYPSFISRLVNPIKGNASAKMRYEMYTEATRVAQTRREAYQDYEAMDTDVIASALDLWADDATQFDPETGKTLYIDCQDTAIKEILEDLFFNILDIEDHVWDIVRTTAKYGDFFVRVVSDPDGGIKYLDYSIYPARIERFDEKGKIKCFVVDENLEMNPWSFVHFRLPGSTIFTDYNKTYGFLDGVSSIEELNDQVDFSPYGQSALAKLRKTWKQLTLLEDSIVLSRLARGMKRNVFQVNVAGLSEAEGFSAVENVGRLIKKQKIVYNDNGMETNTGLLNPEEDIIIPVFSEKGRIDIQEIGGDVEVQHLADIDYLNNKLFAGLKIPKAYLGFEEGLNGRNTLRMLDVRYARTIKNLQRVLVAGLDRIARIHLSLLEIDPMNVDFDIRLPYSSTIEEMERVESMGTKIDALSRVVDALKNMDEEGQILNRSEMLRYILRELAFPEDKIDEMISGDANYFPTDLI